MLTIERLLLSGILLLALAPTLMAQIAVRGETLYTMAGAPIQNGVVLIRDGKIERVGAASEVTIPDGYRLFTSRVVTPGLIDGRGTVGLTGILNQREDQDHLETSSAIQPELRAIDAYNSQDSLVAWLRSFGITTANTGHSPGALASGQTMVVKLLSGPVEEAVLRPEAMVSFTVGQGVSAAFNTPGTRSKGVAMLRGDLLKAQDYARKMEGEESKRPSRDLKMEALGRVLRREVPALVSAHRANDIMTALRLQREFGFRMILDGGAEAYLVLDELREAGIPVLIHPTMMRAGGAAENASMETAARLHEAGITFAFQSGYEAYVPKTRVVLFEAGVAAANGLAPEAALEALTIGAARLLGVEDRIGSLEPGKDADLALFDGDPLEYTTHVCTVIIDGAVVSESCR